MALSRNGWATLPNNRQVTTIDGVLLEVEKQCDRWQWSVQWVGIFISGTSSKLSRAKEAATKWLHTTVVHSHCKQCGSPVSYSSAKKSHFAARGGKLCCQCKSELSSQTMTMTKAKQTPEERSEHGRQARLACTISGSELVRRQWASIKSDPAKMEEISAKRSIRSKKMWAERSDEETNRIIAALIKPVSRSIGNENLKSKMVECGLYEGFSSEVMFHGYCADELSEDLKLVVEYYGDVYHCKPSRYADPDEYVKHIGRTVGEQWQRDRVRLACFYKHGYQVVIVWESDWRNDPTKQLERIREAIVARREERASNSS